MARAATEFLVCKDKEPQQPACLHLVKQFASEGRLFQIRLFQSSIFWLSKGVLLCPFSDGKGRQGPGGRNMASCLCWDTACMEASNWMNYFSSKQMPALP